MLHVNCPSCKSDIEFTILFKHEAQKVDKLVYERTKKITKKLLELKAELKEIKKRPNGALH